MKVIVVGKTDCVLTLNKIGVPIRGKEKAVLEIDTEAKKNEIIALKKAGYLDILEVNTPAIPAPVAPAPKQSEDPVAQSPVIPPASPIKESESKKKSGRPKGSKNKKVVAEKKVNPETKSDQQRADDAEARTQEMGSQVVIGMGNRIVKAKMRSSFEGQPQESDATKESLRAMAEIDKSESEAKTPAKVDETILPPSDQMGRQATVVQEGEQVRSPLSKSIIPEQETIREIDPFIELDPSANDPTKDAFIDKKDDDEDFFLKI